MKKFLVFLALALLVVSGTGYAVTCAYDNVPAATLLVPYWAVSMNAAQCPTCPVNNPLLPSTPFKDTLVGIVNVSAPGVIAHITVWNKYSRAVLDFNVPLTGKDVAYFRMSDILKGNLNVNGNTQYLPGVHPPEPCGIDYSTTPPNYTPDIGWGANQFIRFSNPDANLVASYSGDAYLSLSNYPLNAFQSLAFQQKVWDSLDESGDITFDDAVTNIIDTDNPACDVPHNVPSNGSFKDGFSGYLTIDVVNFCTNFFPSDPQYYTYDAIATVGWGGGNTELTYTPNVLFGDVFFIDSAAAAGNISGDQAVPLEFDSRLVSNTGVKTFYGRYVNSIVPLDCPPLQREKNGSPCTNFNTFAPTFAGAGDYREPLGDRYGFRYFANPASNLQTWITVWRSDHFAGGALDNDLCAWLKATPAGKLTDGFNDANHQLTYSVYNDDEELYTKQGSGGPSGGGVLPPGVLYIYLETQRINLLPPSIVFNPAHWVGGWADIMFRNASADPTTTLLYNQAWVGVEHTSPGLFVSVGHAAANLNNQFNCIPTTVPFAEPGNQ